jgi:hypothetical protein
LKDDEYFNFMHEHAFKGISFDKKYLVKALQRNDGIVFSKYSEFCFELYKLHNQFEQDVENSLHWKFFGVML